MFRLFTLILFLGLVGCSLPKPTTQEVNDARQASWELPTNYEQAIKDYWRIRLVDPTSPMFEFYGVPRKGYATAGWLAGEGIDFGWIVEYGINAKNRMGGYTGNEIRRALIKDNVVIRDSLRRSPAPASEEDFIRYLD